MRADATAVREGVGDPGGMREGCGEDEGWIGRMRRRGAN